MNKRLGVSDLVWLLVSDGGMSWHVLWRVLSLGPWSSQLEPYVAEWVALQERAWADRVGDAAAASWVSVFGGDADAF